MSLLKTCGRIAGDLFNVVASNAMQKGLIEVPAYTDPRSYGLSMEKGKLDG